MSNNRYYSQKKNKTPEQRRQYRKAVESAPISSTGESQDIFAYDSTDKNITSAEEGFPEPLGNMPVAYGFQWTVKSIWQVAIGAIIFLGAVFGVMAYFSKINTQISVNETKIETIEESIIKNDNDLDKTKNELINYIDKQIGTFKEDIKNFYIK